MRTATKTATKTATHTGTDADTDTIEQVDQPVDSFAGTVETCQHIVDFSYHNFASPIVLAKEDRERLADAAEERAKEFIINGCCAGELCDAIGLGDETVEFRGRWWIRGTRGNDAEQDARTDLEDAAPYLFESLRRSSRLLTNQSTNDASPRSTFQNSRRRTTLSRWRTGRSLNRVARAKRAGSESNHESNC